MPNKDIRGADITIPNDVIPPKDQRSGYPYIQIPFQLADGTPAMMVIIRQEVGYWTPSKDIQEIKITYPKKK
jgi:hypothetical protein